MLHPKIEVRGSTISGQGLFATVQIPQGEEIWRETEVTPTYSATEIGSWPEAEQKIFLEHAYQVGAGVWMGYRGTSEDLAMLMNHSCDPNTWFVGDRLMTARRAITPGEEITYDYSTSETERLELNCRCRAECCRGVLSSDYYQTPEFKRSYSGHMLSYIQLVVDSKD